VRIESFNPFNTTIVSVIEWMTFALSIILAALIIAFVIALLYRSWKESSMARSKKDESFITLYLEGLMPDERIPTRDSERRRLLARVIERDVGQSDRLANAQKLYRALGGVERDLGDLKSRWWWRRSHAIYRLTRLHIKEAEPYVHPLMYVGRSEVRISALKYCVHVCPHELEGKMKHIFMSFSRWSYKYIINQLSVAHPSVESLRPLATSRNDDFRKAAAILLGYSGNTPALPLLSGLSDDIVKDVRRESVVSMGKIDHPDAIPYLIEMASDANYQIRREVAKALGKFRDARAFDMLTELADDKAFEVRYHALRALMRYGEKGRTTVSSFYGSSQSIVDELLQAYDRERHHEGGA